MQKSVDVAIIGGGMVGLALACGLHSSGLRIAVLERHIPALFPANEHSTFRVSVINAASEKLLIRLGVWFSIIASHANCFHDMEVWDKDSFGHITFNDKTLGYSHLGHVVENKVIRAALWQKAQQCTDITLIAPAHLQQILWGESEVCITLQSGGVLTAQLVVGADGANSWLRNKAKIPLTFWDDRYHALVATIRTSEPHGNTARQVFHSDGILAFLPLIDTHLCSIVWSLAPESARQMCEAESEVFNRELCMAFDNRLGLCSLEKECQIFPLTSKYASQFAMHRLALIGDAAHTVHPLAGQGVNLGFMDAAELIEELRRLHKEGKDIGHHLHLRRYERSRKYSAAIMLAGMQGFLEFFAGNHPLKKLLRNLGVKLVDTIPGIKRQLLRQAMGLNNLPNWLQ